MQLIKRLAIIGLLLLFVLSLVPEAFAQGASSGESIGAFQRGQAPATPGTRVPGVNTGRSGYWELAGLGSPPAPGAMPTAVDGGMPYNPFCAFGPYGIYGQYSIYGPYGMYGPGGPGYGSGLGFDGFGMNDPWTLLKQYNEEKATPAASGQAKASSSQSAGNATKSTDKTSPVNETAPKAGT